MKQSRQKLEKKRLTKKQREFLEIFFKNLGLVTQSCKAANLSRAMYYRWLEQPLFKEAIEESKTSVKDFGEGELFKLMKAGNPAAVIFFNKTQNKDRGYIEKAEQEITHKGEGIKFILERTDETDKKQIKS